MPDKKSTNGTRYTITDKHFTWTTDEGASVTLPLRIKLRVIRGIAKQDMDVATMFDMLEAVAPGQGDALDDMDINDFQEMFTAWQAEYTNLSGASLGE